MKALLPWSVVYYVVYSLCYHFHRNSCVYNTKTESAFEAIAIV